MNRPGRKPAESGPNGPNLILCKAIRQNFPRVAFVISGVESNTRISKHYSVFLSRPVAGIFFLANFAESKQSKR